MRRQKLTPLTKVVNCKMRLNLQILFPTRIPRSSKNKLFNSPEDSMRNLPTFRDATASFPANWRLRNEHSNSTLKDDVSLPRSGKCFSLVTVNFYPIRSTIQIWVVTRHQYGISTLVPQTSFRGQINSGVARCRLFSQASCLISWGN